MYGYRGSLMVHQAGLKINDRKFLRFIATADRQPLAPQHHGLNTELEFELEQALLGFQRPNSHCGELL
ncbi:uncharacterized protein FIESC28_10932 [Fusarium coffeatum]|uniref:Uncharacterized protein n=1 Tax=Fusarium coffeatum TaxID=231269 RepID=A0A366QRQ9_9HYPO|nr:uncharacterized protein FIESC28_10932 [Fusarium coffeatum]RBR06816.1 hypothetical protein FIESC28_10932 [Fusarium coffeatum]